MMTKQLRETTERVIHALVAGTERHKLLLISTFSIVFFAGFFLIALEKVMWNDELFTFYIARLPHLSDVWKALMTGAEQTPPFFYVITRTSFGIFGVSQLSIRLPEILGAWLMGLCLLVFVWKRSSFLYGFIAMLFPLVTEAFHFATEARAYTLVMGFSAFALLCWQWAAEGRYRWLTLIGLAAGAAAAISSHYYAVLILFPLGLGELVRSVRRKRIDIGIWAALGLSMTPLLLFLPLIESARHYAAHFWAKPHWMSMIDFYHRFLLTPSVLPLILLLVLVMVYAFLRPTPERSDDPPEFPLHEVAAVLGFVLLPVVGVILAKTVIGAYDDRYAFPAVIGLSIVVAWGLYCAFRKSRPMALAACAILVVIFIAKDVRSYNTVAQDRATQNGTYTFLEDYATAAAPIVIANPGPFVELSYHPPHDLGPRLLYLVDPRLALQDTETDDVERGVVEMKQWAGLNVQAFPAYIASGHKCFVYTPNYPDRYEWVIPELLKAHWKLSLIGWQGLDMLFLAEPGGNRDAQQTGK